MSKQTQDVFERIGQAARAAGDTVVTQVKVLELKAQIRSLLQSLGYMVYKTHTGVGVPQEDMDGKLAELDALYAKLDEARDQVSGDRKRAACPEGGTAFSSGDRFCRNCGETL